ncbi:unnamed protein product (macronuclear) [Paramecium tetraurelia]|uniref:TNFR-Cys domain-containing protein n=1 Tax=Paramecium tetraurelia TaxID=5888 RepID=A0E9X2_PARTE|nr:uncharacterized protein GSPATT00024820001 [Paramecium tetraurelia]CAK92089.1 unnamed protein product [Paramecium tetraurelia]|eukprot:XP_001459486.1 hypothetical protein (macronuclear) [Paramecium tetraurelia strain d4-2]
MLHRLFILAISTYSQILYSESFTSNSFTTSEEEWVLSGENLIYSDCGSVRLFGGNNAFGHRTSATKLFQLPPHHTVSITLEFWKIDTWDDEKFFIYLDQILGFQDIYGHGGTDICGKSSGEFVVQINIMQPHNFQSLFILMTSNLDQQPNDESWGIRNFKLYIYPCPSGCQICVSTDLREDCIIWNNIEKSLLSVDFNSFNFDGWTIDQGYKFTSYCLSIPMIGGYLLTGENSYMFKTINLSAHSQIIIQFRFIFLDSWNAKHAYLYIDNNVIWTETYDFNNRQIQDLCGWIYDDKPFNVQITMPHTGSSITLNFTTNLNQGLQNESFGIRDIQIFIACLFGSSFNQACGTICGNGVIEQYEECDDGNIYSFDGCFNCQYSCIEGCSNCIDGICFECSIGWSFGPNFNTCTPIANDEKYSIWEECDDLLNFEICKNGKFITPSNCLSYQFGICFKCQVNYELINNKCEAVCQNQAIVNDIECLDNNLYALDRCHQCAYDLDEGCRIQQNGVCIQCLDGWKFDMVTDICTPICGNHIIEGPEECDININTKSQFGCQQCYFDCQYECTDCQFGICHDCISGWKLKNQQCESICGDNQIQFIDECDDMNKIRFDGCYNCRNDCQRECSYCFKGVCLDCIYGWHLTAYFTCEFECGDSQIALISQEECDDSNDMQLDGCFGCKIECCRYCTQCIYGICYDCEYTFTLINQECNSVCGDGLVSAEYEQCDDMNRIPYDGCYNCNYQCRQFCKLCIQGVCYDQCEQGYYQVDNVCYPICGDGIIVEEEDCDDQNVDKSDGCFNCFFYCPDHCNVCAQGKCKVCEQGYELNKGLNECFTLCGNGLVSIEEECDDMNQQNGDGCSSLCTIETNYVCKNFLYSFTECIYIRYPKFEASLIRQDYSIQYVSLHFDQQVKILGNKNFSGQIQFNLVGVDFELYNITLMIVQEVQQYCTFVEYMVAIQINTTLLSHPILEVILKEQLYNENEAPLINQIDKVKLNLPKYIVDKKKQSAQVLKNVGTNIMKSIGGMGILMLLIGHSFGGIIEILQQQSYLKFINVVFPLNLFIYFESSNIITVQPLLDFFHFNSVVLNIMNTEFVESKEKFLFYEIDATQIFLSLGVIFMYIGCIFLIQKFISMQNLHYFYFGITVASYFVKVQNACFMIKRKCEKVGLIQFYITNCWDLLFMSFLQISSQSFTTIKSAGSIILGYLIIYACAIIISNYFFKDTKYTSLSRYNLKKLDLFLIFKKFLFVGILVLFQRNQQIQSILLAFVSNCSLIYLILFKSRENKVDYFNQIIMEASVFVFCSTIALYWDLMQESFDYDNQILLGWFHISMLLLVLVINLGLQLYTFLMKLRKTWIKKMQKPQNQSSDQQKDPIPQYQIKQIVEFKQ